MTEIRQATTDDAKEIFRALVEVVQETDYINLNFNPQKAFTKIMQWIQRDNAIMLVAFCHGEVAGFLSGSLFSMWLTDDKSAIEEAFLVKKKFRGKGIASLLLGEFMAWTKDKCSHVMTGVSTGRGAAAEHLYAKHGMLCTGGNYIKHY